MLHQDAVLRGSAWRGSDLLSWIILSLQCCRKAPSAVVHMPFFCLTSPDEEEAAWSLVVLLLWWFTWCVCVRVRSRVRTRAQFVCAPCVRPCMCVCTTPLCPAFICDASRKHSSSHACQYYPSAGASRPPQPPAAAQPLAAHANNQRCRWCLWGWGNGHGRHGADVSKPCHSAGCNANDAGS